MQYFMRSNGRENKETQICFCILEYSVSFAVIVSDIVHNCSPLGLKLLNEIMSEVLRRKQSSENLDRRTAFSRSYKTEKTFEQLV